METPYSREIKTVGLIASGGAAGGATHYFSNDSGNWLLDRSIDSQVTDHTYRIDQLKDASKALVAEHQDNLQSVQGVLAQNNLDIRTEQQQIIGLEANRPPIVGSFEGYMATGFMLTTACVGAVALRRRFRQHP